MRLLKQLWRRLVCLLTGHAIRETFLAYNVRDMQYVVRGRCYKCGKSFQCEIPQEWIEVVCKHISDREEKKDAE